ncbi:hypothetical protein VUR80DRAFT_5820 [Thermomyces stellatus]
MVPSGLATACQLGHIQDQSAITQDAPFFCQLITAGPEKGVPFSQGQNSSRPGLAPAHRGVNVMRVVRRVSYSRSRIWRHCSRQLHIPLGSGTNNCSCGQRRGLSRTAKATGAWNAVRVDRWTDGASAWRWERRFVAACGGSRRDRQNEIAPQGSQPHI